MFNQMNAFQQPITIYPYSMGTTISYIMPQNPFYQQTNQNASNMVFTFPMQLYSQMQQPVVFTSQSNNNQNFYNNQQYCPTDGMISAQEKTKEYNYMKSSDNTYIPFQQSSSKQNQIQEQLNSDFLQQENTKSNHIIQKDYYLNYTHTQSEQALQESPILTHVKSNIESNKQQSCASQEFQNFNNQIENHHTCKGYNTEKKDQLSSGDSSITAVTRQQKKNKILHVKNNCKNFMKSEEEIKQNFVEEVQNVVNLSNNQVNHKSYSETNSSQFVFIKKRKQIIQGNQQYSQQETELESNCQNLQVQSAIQQQVSRVEGNNNQEDRESSSETGQQQKTQKNKKSRNYSKNLLKSFFKYTIQANSDNKRFLFNFKRYIASNKSNNDLIIKLLTSSPYQSYFEVYLGQPATDWIENSKVQKLDEQMKFLELCRKRQISDLKKKNHTKKKSLFSLNKQ